MTGNNRNNNNEVKLEIIENKSEHNVSDKREEKWTKEVNLVAWNGGKPKIDIRDWNASHERMGRGITLTEEQSIKLTKALVDRYRTRANQEHGTPMRDDDYAR